MYLRHCRPHPGSPSRPPPHTDELFESNARREAEARLHHLIELKGIGLITGEVGSGKTTVCRHVTAALHCGLYRVGYVSLTTGNVLDMYKSIAWELGLPTERSRATAYRAIREEITRLVCEGQTAPRPRHRRSPAPAQRCPRRPPAPHQLRHGQREPPVPAARRTHRVAPPTRHGRARIARPAPRRASPPSPDSTARNSTPTSPTACVSPAANSPCSNPPPSRRWRTARADCPDSSIASHTTRSPPPPRKAPAPSPPSTSNTPSRSCGW